MLISTRGNLYAQISMSVNLMWINVQSMPLVLTLREVMNVAALLDSLEMAHYAVCG